MSPRSTFDYEDHLAYVRGRAESGEFVRYDIYPADGGSQLGSVAMVGTNRWQAISPDGLSEVASTRWEAASSLWPAGRNGSTES